MLYHKIQSVFKRDPETKYKTFLSGDWSVPEFGFLVNNVWTGTEKVDGTNIRVEWNGEKIVFGGKTDRAQIPAHLVNVLNERFNNSIVTAWFVSNFGLTTPVTLFGEGYGAKIQKGGGNYKSDGADFVLFDINVAGLWLERENVADIANQLNIDVVPVCFTGNLWDAISNVSLGFNSTWGNFAAEGLVLRPEIELLTRRGQRIITKVKHRDFK